MRTADRLCPCAFIFKEVLSGEHFGDKNDKRKSGEILARSTYGTLGRYDQE